MAKIQQGKRGSPTPTRATFSKRARHGGKSVEALPKSVLSACLSLLPCGKDLAAILCSSHRCFDLQCLDGAWSSLSHTLDTTLLQRCWLCRVPRPLGPIQAVLLLNRWRALRTSDELPSILTAALSMRTCKVYGLSPPPDEMDRDDTALMGNLAKLPSFSNGFTEARRVTRFNPCPESDSEGECDYEDYLADDGPVVPLHGEINGYGKVMQEVSCSIVLCGHRISLRAETCCEVDEGNCTISLRGSVHISRAIRQQRKAPDSSCRLLSWKVQEEAEIKEHMFSKSSANQLAKALGSHSAAPLAACDVPRVLAKLFEGAFRGVSLPHDYCEDDDWAELLQTQFLACGMRGDEANAIDMNDGDGDHSMSDDED